MALSFRFVDSTVLDSLPMSTFGFCSGAPNLRALRVGNVTIHVKAVTSFAEALACNGVYIAPTADLKKGIIFMGETLRAVAQQSLFGKKLRIGLVPIKINESLSYGTFYDFPNQGAVDAFAPNFHAAPLWSRLQSSLEFLGDFDGELSVFGYPNAADLGFGFTGITSSTTPVAHPLVTGRAGRSSSSGKIVAVPPDLVRASTSDGLFSFVSAITRLPVNLPNAHWYDAVMKDFAKDANTAKYVPKVFEAMIKAGSVTREHLKKAVYFPIHAHYSSIGHSFSLGKAPTWFEVAHHTATNTPALWDAKTAHVVSYDATPAPGSLGLDQLGGNGAVPTRSTPSETQGARFYGATFGEVARTETGVPFVLPYLPMPAFGVYRTTHASTELPPPDPVTGMTVVPASTSFSIVPGLVAGKGQERFGAVSPVRTPGDSWIGEIEPFGRRANIPAFWDQIDIGKMFQGVLPGLFFDGSGRFTILNTSPAENTTYDRELLSSLSTITDKGLDWLLQSDDALTKETLPVSAGLEIRDRPTLAVPGAWARHDDAIYFPLQNFADEMNQRIINSV